MAQQEQKAPIRVVLTGAAGQIGYALVPYLCNGSVFGKDQPVIVHLLDIPNKVKDLGGVVMEIQDCAYPLLRGVVATADLKEAFSAVDVAVLVGGFPRLPGMERKDLLHKNRDIFVAQGQALKQYANPNVKVLVVANPANTNCMIAINNACGQGSKLSPSNFSCLTRLDMNRAKFQLANRLNTAVPNIKNVIIWGNHSATMYPDLAHSVVTIAGQDKKVADLPEEEKKLAQPWLTEFTKTVQQRGAAILAARGFSSALSAACAIADHLRDWIHGTAPGEFVSMGVWSDGSYGVAKDIVYSFPCTCKNGVYTIVQGLSISAEAKAAMQFTENELLEEKAIAATPATTTTK